jgi:hypothetical protein
MMKKREKKSIDDKEMASLACNAMHCLMLFRSYLMPVLPRFKLDRTLGNGVTDLSEEGLVLEKGHEPQGPYGNGKPEQGSVSPAPGPGRQK